jgi:hypothetical protein
VAGRHVLKSQGQGRLPPQRIKRSFTLEYQKGEEIDGYIFLRYPNIESRNLVVEYPDLFAQRSKIYTAGVSAIYATYR